MNHTTSASKVAYGRKLVAAGISGIRMGQRSPSGESVSTILADSARDSLKLAAAGACLGLLPSCVSRRRPSLSNAVALSVLGSALGFCAGFAWKTRKIASSVAHSAAKELGYARDQHWLETNPIDYA